MSESQHEQGARRQEIVDSMSIASNLITTAAARGDFALDSPNRTPTLTAIYDLTERALSLFRVGEEEVAWWAQVEFYAGLAEPLVRLLDDEPFTDIDGTLLFTPPRPGMLQDWADGESLGPRFRGQHSTAPGNIDTQREALVVPFSEAPAGMQWAPLLDWRNGAPEPDNFSA